MLHKFSFMNSPGQILTKRGGGETRLLLERDQKRDQAKKQSLKIFFWQILSSVEHKKHRSRFFTRPTPLVALKWLILRQNETQGTRLGFPSPPYWVFFTPTLRVCTGLRRSVVYADVRTKFSWIHRFSANFSSLRARWRSTIINFIIIIIILNGCIVLLYC